MHPWYGLPYLLGGREVPPQRGYDCAGAVLEAYWRMGINLSHVPPLPDPFPDYAVGKWYTSAQRLYEHPRIVPVKEPQPGDLVFWRATYDHWEDITHVLMYVGPSRYVGAQSPVLGEYSNDDRWWTQRLVGYGRPER